MSEKTATNLEAINFKALQRISSEINEVSEETFWFDVDRYYDCYLGSELIYDGKELVGAVKFAAAFLLGIRARRKEDVL